MLQHPRLFATALGVALLGALVVQHRGAGVDVPPPRSELTAVAAQGGAPTASPAGSPTAAPLASPTAVSPAVQAADGAAAVRRWTSVLAEIDEGRTSSLAVGSTASLREWVTGIAYLADEGLARAVGEADARIEGGGLVVETVIVVRADGTTAVLRVRDRRTAYTVVRDGVRQPVPERAARWWTVTLVLGGSPARWRIAEVADADLSPGGRR